jgi:medium-chain acyl-[acyl-carrier-protein] hydrolase
MVGSLQKHIIGQTIVSLTKIDDNETRDKSFIHTIKIKGTDKVCATAKTIWKKIKTQTHSYLAEKYK